MQDGNELDRSGASRGLEEIEKGLLLRSSSPGSDSLDSAFIEPARKRHAFVSVRNLSLSSNFLLALVCIWLWTNRNPSRLPYWPVAVYSPADSAIEYETVVFADGFHQKTIYTSTTDEADRAWLDLYNDIQDSQIPTREAQLLPNVTSPNPDDLNTSIVGLDVFHQLHCLNLLRQRLHPDIPKYNMTLYHHFHTKAYIDAHVDHCIDSIRQSLMCNADISTIYYQWKPSRNKTLPNGAVTHTCRRWDRLMDWAIRHRVQNPFADGVRAEGAPIYTGPD